MRINIDNAMIAVAATGVAFSASLLVTIVGHVATRGFHKDDGPQAVLTDFAWGLVIIGSTIGCHRLLQVVRAKAPW